MQFDGHNVVAISGCSHKDLLDWVEAGMFNPVIANGQFAFLFSDVFIACTCRALAERGVTIERLKMVSNVIRETPAAGLENQVLAVSAKSARIVSMPIAKRLDASGKRIILAPIWRNFVMLKRDIQRQLLQR